MDPFYQPPIATKQPLFSQRTLMLVVGLVIAVIIAIFLMVLANSGGIGDQYARAIAREQSLLQLIQIGPDNIENPDLRKITADAELFATSDVAALSANLSRFGLKGIPEDITSAELTSTAEASLDEAKLQNRFDEVYTELLTTKVDSQQALLKDIYDQLGNGPTRDTVQRVYNNLASIQKDIEEL